VNAKTGAKDKVSIPYSAIAGVKVGENLPDEELTERQVRGKVVGNLVHHLIAHRPGNLSYVRSELSRLPRDMDKSVMEDVTQLLRNYQELDKQAAPVEQVQFELRYSWTDSATGERLTANPDRIAYTTVAGERMLQIMDIKTGKIHSNVLYQLRHYALVVALKLDYKGRIMLVARILNEPTDHIFFARSEALQKALWAARKAAQQKK